MKTVGRENSRKQPQQLKRVSASFIVLYATVSTPPSCNVNIYPPQKITHIRLPRDIAFFFQLFLVWCLFNTSAWMPWSLEPQKEGEGGKDKKEMTWERLWLPSNFATVPILLVVK